MNGDLRAAINSVQESYPAIQSGRILHALGGRPVISCCVGSAGSIRSLGSKLAWPKTPCRTLSTYGPRCSLRFAMLNLFLP